MHYYKPIAPRHCGNPKRWKPVTHSSMICCVGGIFLICISDKASQTSSQNSRTIKQTVALPTPNNSAITLYSAEEPNANKAIATRFFNGIAGLQFVSALLKLLRNP